MARAAAAPAISGWLLRAFRVYVRAYLRRHFSGLRVAGALDAAWEAAGRGPIVVVTNHPSWWDPLLALALTEVLHLGRRACAPIDAAALRRYPLLGRFGLFGIEPGVAGARAFLDTSAAVLADPTLVLWLTPQGRFVDVRERPVALAPGVGHVLRRLDRRECEAALVPIALELTFWDERLPEALAYVGEPVRISGGAARGVEAWTATAAAALEGAQDALAPLARARDAGAFTTLLAGRSGVGGVYDLLRRARAWLGGERFEAAHRGPVAP